MNVLAGDAEPPDDPATPADRVRGWVFMDFFQQPAGSMLVSLLVECNFRGRRQGEEGWTAETREP